MVKPTLIKYTRKSNGQLNGCIVGTMQNDKVMIGYSKCSKADRFSKARALELATIRMNSRGSFASRLGSIPLSLIKDTAKFCDRLGRYYKNSPIGRLVANETNFKELIELSIENNPNRSSS